MKNQSEETPPSPEAFLNGKSGILLGNFFSFFLQLLGLI